MDMRIEVRDGRTDDVEQIAGLVSKCGPYLTNHCSYLYFIYTYCFGQSCSVALVGGKIVGWCSVLPTPTGASFLHQLAVHPDVRGQGVAFCLFSHVVGKLRALHPDDFRLEFTMDRKNEAAHRLNLKVARNSGLQLRKLMQPVHLLEQESEEELYEMTPLSLEGATANPFPQRMENA